MNWKRFWKQTDVWLAVKMYELIACEPEMKGYVYFNLLCKGFIFSFFCWNWLLVNLWMNRAFQNYLYWSLQVNRKLNTATLLDRRIFWTILSLLTEFEYKPREQTCRWGRESCSVSGLPQENNNNTIIKWKHYFQIKKSLIWIWSSASETGNRLLLWILLLRSIWSANTSP